MTVIKLTVVKITSRDRSPVHQLLHTNLRYSVISKHIRLLLLYILPKGDISGKARSSQFRALGSFTNLTDPCFFLIGLDLHISLMRLLYNKNSSVVAKFNVTSAWSLTGRSIFQVILLPKGGRELKSHQ